MSVWSRDFTLYFAARTLTSVGVRIMLTGVGWHIYEMTDSVMALGFVGLALFVPTVFLALPAGDLADRFDRRLVALGALCGLALGSGGLAWLTLAGVTAPIAYYAVLGCFGTAQCVWRPVEIAVIASIVPRDQLARAVALGASAVQGGILFGPVIGGTLYYLGPAVVYGAAAMTFVVAAGAGLFIRLRDADEPARAGGSSLARLGEALAYVRRHPVILGPMALDFFVVLIGGIYALLPVFARDILEVGPAMLGVLRSSPAIGSVLTGMILARLTLSRRVGPTMLVAVTVFGAATIVVGLSTDVWLTTAALLVMGGANMVSVTVRHTLLQFATPNALRGRVSSVHALLGSSGSQLGDLEAGLLAALVGAPAAAIIGGAATMTLALAWTWLFTGLRRVDRLSDVAPR